MDSLRPLIFLLLKISVFSLGYLPNEVKKIETNIIQKRKLLKMHVYFKKWKAYIWDPLSETRNKMKDLFLNQVILKNFSAFHFPLRVWMENHSNQQGMECFSNFLFSVLQGV